MRADELHVTVYMQVFMYMRANACMCLDMHVHAVYAHMQMYMRVYLCKCTYMLVDTCRRMHMHLYMTNAISIK